MEEDIRKWLDTNYGKKIIVIYGNCHTAAIRFIIEQIEDIKDQFAIYPLLAIQDVKNPEYFNNGIIQNCDIFIHQVIRDNNRYGLKWASREILKKTKPGCQIIGIPNVYHMPVCFFQQFSEKRDFRGRTNHTVFFRDTILDKAYAERWSMERTIDYYENKDFVELEKIRRDFDLFIEKLLVRERDWDIKITDFILDNYRQQKLFYDPNHPTQVIIKELVDRLLDYLDIRYNSDFLYENFPLDSFEMPICGCVKRALNLDFHEMEYRETGIKRVKGAMKLEDYVREYWTYEWQNNEISIVGRSTSALNYLCATIEKKLL